MEMALVKMVIRSFPNRNYSGKIIEFKLPVNPETLTKNFKVELDKQSPAGSQGIEPRYKRTAPEEFKIEFILDGTRTIEGYGYDGLFTEGVAKTDSNSKDAKPKEDELVEKQLENFLTTVYQMDGDIHRPRFCILTWGTELFRGVISSLDVNYSLFHPNGKPLRVKMNATFIDFIAKEEREKKNRKRSPDLTKIRRVNSGDRLDKMVSDLYGDPKFLIQVARANGLTSFRKIDQRSELRFPPIDKTEIV